MSTYSADVSDTRRQRVVSREASSWGLGRSEFSTDISDTRRGKVRRACVYSSRNGEGNREVSHNTERCVWNPKRTMH